MPIKKVHSSFNAATINAHSSDFKTPVCCTLIKIFLILIVTPFLSAQIKDIGTPTTSGSDWKFLGLEKEMITAIAVDWSNPEIIYAGSWSNFSAGTVGGIFKSTNGGADWDTLMRGVTVRDLDIHPKDPKIIFASLGLNVLTQPGIIKSADGGSSWIKSDDGIEVSWEIGVGVLLIDPLHPDTLYCGTSGPHGGELYKSTNAGKAWFPMDVPTLSGIISIAINVKNTNNIYIGTDDVGNMYKSIDGGISWSITSLTSKNFIYDIIIDPYSEILYAGTDYGFFSSTDGGATWIQNNAGLPERVIVFKIQFFRSQQFPIDSKIFINVNASLGIFFLNDKSEWENFGNVGSWFITIFDNKIYAGSFGGIYVSDIISSTSDQYYIPSSIKLFQNYPNPFNSETKIIYEINGEENVTIEVFDLLGRKIKTLVNESKPQGRYTAIWDGTDETGRLMPSGIYIYRLTHDRYQQSKKMMLIH